MVQICVERHHEHSYSQSERVDVGDRNKAITMHTYIRLFLSPRSDQVMPSNVDTRKEGSKLILHQENKDM